MRGEPVELACPFCDKGIILCWHIPSSISQKNRSSATFGKVREKVRNPDVWLIQSGCSVCKKSAEEVEKELRKKNII